MYDKIFLIILGIVLSASGIIKQTGLYISFIAPLILFFCLDLKYKLINFSVIYGMCILRKIIGWLKDNWKCYWKASLFKNRR